MRHGSKWNPDKHVREQELWDEHARFMDALFEERRVVLAGPFADESGSLVVLSAESVDEAKSIFQNDPWAREDILIAGDIKEWTIFLDGRDKG